MPRTPATVAARSATPAAVWAALATVYVVWGSTYLAIRIAIRTLPPMLMASVRFLLAGALLYAIAVRRGERDADRPGRAEWRAATVVGAALLLGGNGGVVWAEQHIDTGTAALIVATVPLWMALLDRVVYGARLTRQSVAGLVAGLGGVALLVDPGGGRQTALGVLAVLGASVSWAAGSLFARRARLPARPLVGTGMEMLAGGALLGIVAVASGEPRRLDVAAVSGESVAALLYLVVFGALVAFSAYVWVLRVAPTPLVATYAYVNPVVAVILGWLVLGEDVTPRTAVAGALVVASVAMIVTGRRPPEPDTESLGPNPAHSSSSPTPG